MRHQARFCDDLNTPLKEYDASCSQWWCFTTLELKKVQGFVAQYFPQHLEAVIVMSQKLALKDDYQLFKELTTKGAFYEYMVEKINSYYQQRFEAGLMKRRRRVDRNYFKSKSMQILFSQDIAEGTLITHKGRTFPKKISVAERVFKAEFKYVYRAMKIYRKLMTNSGFACLLQAVESHIWLDGLAGLMIDQGFSDFVTVHDCICIKDTLDNRNQFEACCDYYFREVLRIERPNIFRTFA